MLELTNYAFIAGIAAFWGQIKGLIERIRSLFIIRVTLYGSIAQSTSNYLWREGRVLRWGDRFIRSGGVWVRPLARVTEVAYESPPMQPLIAWIHGRPLMFQCPQDEGKNLPGNFEVLVLTSLRGCLDVESITQAALQFTQKRQTSDKGRYFVRRIGGRPSHQESGAVPMPASGGCLSSNEGITPEMRFLHWQSQDIGSPLPKVPFASLSLCSQGTEAAADFRRWLQLKTWYADRGIPWRRGHLFYGPPGTGKTSLARALAQESDMPVFAFDLSTLDNEQFSRHWQEMQEHTPCMALIEDIDGAFHGRKNILANDRRETLTFDCLLNALGGIQTCDGVFIVITTNAPEKLDSALCIPAEDTTTSRPGRIDRAYCLRMPGEEQRRSILVRICGKATFKDLAATDSMSAAQVTEYAITTALNTTWNTD